ncbi:MAG: transcription termination/antitermination protein NusA [Anaerolineae bacterium]|nr:transcription termination/antitermination protein NusA [Anaerolineae bacterium]
MKNEFVLAINEIVDERALPREIILEALRSALVTAYRRDVSVGGQNVDAEIDMTNGRVVILVEKEVVQSVQDPRTEITLEAAREINPNVTIGDTIMVPFEDTTRKFGRIAAQTAKQIILQKIREAERKTLYEEYIERQGDLISGTVQSVTPQGLTVSLGRAEALLPRAHMIPKETYKPHDKVRAILLEVKPGNRGPQIILSRSHRNMLRRLLEYEVPEIFNGQVEIKNIAREAGYRSKVAVAALQEGVDPVGACVGMRGIRIQNIVRELSEEKIDVIEWSPDPATFITKALSPARVAGVFLDEYADSGSRGGMGTATVIVPDDQLSLAIGREGQNARLAAKLTGWRIDIKSVTESVTSALQNTESPALAAFNREHADLLAEVRRIMEKREANRPVMPEEFQTLAQYARQVESVLLNERRAVNKRHQDHLQAVRATLPEGAFQVPVTDLDIPAPLVRALATRFETAGEVMLYLIVDEDRVRKALKRAQEDDEDALAVVKRALDRLVIPAPVAEPEVTAEVAEAATEAETTLVEPVEVEAPAAEPAMAEAAGEEEVLPAILEPELEEETPVEARPVVAPKPVVDLEPEFEPVAPYVPRRPVFEPEEEEELPRFQPAGKKSKKGKGAKRELIFDEETGKMVARRKRKGSRRRSSFFDDFEDEI